MVIQLFDIPFRFVPSFPILDYEFSSARRFSDAEANRKKERNFFLSVLNSEKVLLSLELTWNFISFFLLFVYNSSLYYCLRH